MTGSVLATSFAVMACSAADEGPATADAVPSTLRDTTGAEFEVVNGNLDELLPGTGAELPPECGGIQPTEFAVSVGETGLSMICVLDPDTAGPIDILCRPIACDTVSDCTPGMSCIDAICRCMTGSCRTTAGGGRVVDDELVALCLAADQRLASCPTEADDLWVLELIGSSCDEETGLCSVPSECQ